MNALEKLRHKNRKNLATPFERKLLNEIEKMYSELKESETYYFEQLNIWQQNYIELQETNSQLREELRKQKKELANLQKSMDTLHEKLTDIKQKSIYSQKQNSQLQKEIKKRSRKFDKLQKKIKELQNSETYLHEQLNKWQQNYIDLQETNSQLRKEKEILEKHQLKPFKKEDNRSRGGCKLTDHEIERLLMIFAKQGRYANMSLTQAIREVSQTHQTYYRVIKRGYSSEATRLRIEALASKLKIILPERGKLK